MVQVPFLVRLENETLREPLARRKPARILTGFMGDVFCGDWGADDLNPVFNVIEEARQHRIIVLTKRHRTMAWYHNLRGGFPDNLWVGVTVMRASDYHRIDRLLAIDHPNRFVSFEPLLEPIHMWLPSISQLGWAIIGARTGSSPFQPPRVWVDRLVTDLELRGVPYFIKDNLDWDGPRPQGYPEGLVLDWEREMVAAEIEDSLKVEI